MDRSHPADDRLIALYFGDEGANADERRTARQHLHGCEACTWRYTELTAPLERLRQDAASEADEVFTPGRLDRQRSAILDRIDGAATASRVIAFPSTPIRLDRSLIRRPLSRWIAAAAAAGLFIGVMAGRLFEFSAARVNAPVPISRSVRTVIAPTTGSVNDTAAATAFEVDEIALSELDQAVNTQRIAALSALDEMTPHIRPEAMIARARSIR